MSPSQTGKPLHEHSILFPRIDLEYACTVGNFPCWWQVHTRDPSNITEKAVLLIDVSLITDLIIESRDETRDNHRQLLVINEIFSNYYKFNLRSFFFYICCKLSLNHMEKVSSIDSTIKSVVSKASIGKDHSVNLDAKVSGVEWFYHITEVPLSALKAYNVMSWPGGVPISLSGFTIDLYCCSQWRLPVEQELKLFSKLLVLFQIIDSGTYEVERFCNCCQEIGGITRSVKVHILFQVLPNHWFAWHFINQP